jgi:putative methionine-R-sulfoxide reductase with GAF domain
MNKSIKYTIAFGRAGNPVPIFLLVFVIAISAFFSSPSVFGMLLRGKRQKLKNDGKAGFSNTEYDQKTVQRRDSFKNLESARSERTKRLQPLTTRSNPLLQIGQEGTPNLDIDRLLQNVADLIRDAFGCSQVNIYLTDSSKKRLILHAASGASYPLNKIFEISTSNLNGKAAYLNLCEIVNDIHQASTSLSDRFLPGACSELAAPLHKEDEMIGTLDIHSRKINAFSPQDITIIQRLGDRISVLIEKARLYQLGCQDIVVEKGNQIAEDSRDSFIQSFLNLRLLIEDWRRRLNDRKQHPT